MSKAKKLLEMLESKNFLGSAPNLEMLLSDAKKRLFRDDLEFKEEGKNTWSVYDHTGELVQFIVKKVKGRYRLELSGKEAIKRIPPTPSQKGVVLRKVEDGYYIKGEDGKEYYFFDAPKLKIGSKIEFKYNKHGAAFF